MVACGAERTVVPAVARAVALGVCTLAAMVVCLIAGRAVAMAGRTSCLGPVIRGIYASRQSKSVCSIGVKYKPAFEGSPLDSVPSFS